MTPCFTRRQTTEPEHREALLTHEHVRNGGAKHTTRLHFQAARTVHDKHTIATTRVSPCSRHLHGAQCLRAAWNSRRLPNHLFMDTPHHTHATNLQANTLCHPMLAEKSATKLDEPRRHVPLTSTKFAVGEEGGAGGGTARSPSTAAVASTSIVTSVLVWSFGGGRASSSSAGSPSAAAS